MNKTSWIAVVSKESRSLLDQVAFEEVNGLKGLRYVYQYEETDLYFACSVHYYNCQKLHVIDTETLYILAIGYRVYQVNLASEIEQRYLLNGLQGMSELDGTYQLILIDKNKKNIFIGKDPAGLASLYYYQGDDALLFSNNIKNLLLQDCFTPSFNDKVLFELFSLNAVVPPDTLIKEVLSLPSLHWLCYEGNSRWSVRPIEPENKIPDGNELIDYLKGAFLSPTTSSPSIGIMASGGFDSSLITSLVRAQTDNPIHLFTLCYDKMGSTDEITRELAQCYHAEHSVFSSQVDNPLKLVYESLWYMESEAVGSISFNLVLELIFSRFTASFHPHLILTGDTYFSRTDPLETVEHYEKNYTILKDKAALKNLTKDKHNGLSQYFHKKRAYANIRDFPLPEVLALRVISKIRMNQSIDVNYYSPFLNQEYTTLVYALRRMKPEYKNRDHLISLCRKHRLLSESILTAKKSWLPSWIEQDKPVKFLEHCMSVISHPQSFVRSLFNADYIEMITQEYQQNRFQFLILLFYLELFFDNFIVHPKRLLHKNNMR